MTGCLHKSWFMITIFIIISILFSLLGAHFVMQTDALKPIEGLSDNFRIIEIGTADQTKNIDLINKVNSMNKSIMLANNISGVGYEEGFAVYYTTANLFMPKLDKGRVFSKDELEGKSRVAVIKSNGDSKTFKQGVNEYIRLFGHKYKVVGRFSSKNSMSSPDWYISLCSPDMLKKRIFGQYYLDASGNHIKDVENTLATVIKDKSQEANIKIWKGTEPPEQGAFQTADEKPAMMLFLILTAVLILINAFSACYYWIESRKREMAIRRLCGATEKDIRLLISREYFVLLSCSFILGAILTQLFLLLANLLPVKESVYFLFGDRISWPSISVGFSLSVVVSAPILLSTLLRMKKMEIVEALNDI